MLEGRKGASRARALRNQYLPPPRGSTRTRDTAPAPTPQRTPYTQPTTALRQSDKTQTHEAVQTLHRKEEP